MFIVFMISVIMPSDVILTIIVLGGIGLSVIRVAVMAPPPFSVDSNLKDQNIKKFLLKKLVRPPFEGIS